jgi:hypothetical protein
MTIKSKLAVLGLIILSLAAAPQVYADGIPRGRQLGIQYASTLPEYYPDHFDRTGVIQRLRMQGNRLLINATRYKLDPNVHVYTLHTRFGTMHSLRKNMAVGFTLRPARVDEQVISEIWELPPDSVKLH